MKGILALPDDIVENVTRKNWSKLYDEYMIHDGDYVWTPETMKEFIKNIVDRSKETEDEQNT